MGLELGQYHQFSCSSIKRCGHTCRSVSSASPCTTQASTRKGHVRSSTDRASNSEYTRHHPFPICPCRTPAGTFLTTFEFKFLNEFLKMMAELNSCGNPMWTNQAAPNNSASPRASNRISEIPRWTWRRGAWRAGKRRDHGSSRYGRTPAFFPTERLENLDLTRRVRPNDRRREPRG